MSGDSKQGEKAGQASADSQSQADTDPTPPAGGAQSGQEPGAAAEASTSAASQSDDDGSTGDLGKLRRENAGLRGRLRTLEKAEEERQQASMTEVERLKAQLAAKDSEIAELRTRDGERTVRLAVVEVANRLGFRNPEMAYKLLDADAVVRDDEGNPTNVEKLLKNLLEKEPYLGKAPGSPDYGAGQRGRSPDSTPGMSELLKKAAGY